MQMDHKSEFGRGKMREDKILCVQSVDGVATATHKQKMVVSTISGTHKDGQGNDRNIELFSRLLVVVDSAMSRDRGPNAPRSWNSQFSIFFVLLFLVLF